MTTDVTEYERFGEVVDEVERLTGGAGLNLLINNAGIMAKSNTGLTEVTKEILRDHFEVNTIAPILLTQV
jgi:NAD(P)-dependent dehydrogenase (short-subunit alcohol dehydrogenase family)